MKIKKLSAFVSCAGALALALLLPAGTAQAALIHWSGAAGDHDWANAGNWDGGVAPGGADNALFDLTDAQTGYGVNSVTNNILTQNFTVSSLIYSNWTAGPTSGALSDPVDPSNLYSQHTEITSGKTLTVTNGITVGVSSAFGKGFPGHPLTYATTSGVGGTLAVTGGLVQVGYQSSESSTLHVYARWDMSDLGNFNYNVSGGTFGIASAVHRRQGGEVYLARTNVIASSSLLVGIGASGVASYSALLHLGQSNVLNANTITIGKDTEGDIDFQRGLTNATLTIRGSSGTNPAGTVNLGWTTSSGSSFGRGTNDFTGGIVDAAMTNLNIALHAGDITSDATTESLLIGSSSNNTFNVLNNLTIGTDPGTASTTKATHSNGLLDMQNGTFTANNVIIGSANNAGTGNGTLNLAGGTFTASNVAMGISTANGIATGNLNLNGGTMSVAGNIAITNVVTGYSAGTIGVSGATLDVGGRIGASNAYMTTVSFQQSVLKLGLGGSTNVGLYADALAVEGPTTIAITSANLATGQFPIIAYHSFTGASGFAGLSVSLPSGVAATLVDNSVNQSVDLLVTSVPAVTPVLLKISYTGANTISVTGSGTANAAYHAYFSADVSLPILQWSSSNVNADATGLIQFLDNSTNAQRFYRLGR